MIEPVSGLSRWLLIYYRRSFRSDSSSMPSHASVCLIQMPWIRTIWVSAGVNEVQWSFAMLLWTWRWVTHSQTSAWGSEHKWSSLNGILTHCYQIETCKLSAVAEELRPTSCPNKVLANNYPGRFDQQQPQIWSEWHRSTPSFVIEWVTPGKSWT